MDAGRDKREARKNMYFERYGPVSLGILMYGAGDNIKLGKTLFPNRRHICPKTNDIYCNKIVDLKFVELTADVLEIFLILRNRK